MPPKKADVDQTVSGFDLRETKLLAAAFLSQQGSDKAGSLTLASNTLVAVLTRAQR